VGGLDGSLVCVPPAGLSPAPAAAWFVPLGGLYTRFVRLFRRPSGPVEDWQPRLYAIVIGLVLIVLWLIAFIVKNNDPVKIDFVLFSAHARLIWLFILLIAIGFLGGVLGSQLYRRRRRSGRSQLPEN
jgi:uncharacterized integral membrane protein